MLKAILAGVNLGQIDFDNMIEECIELCKASDIKIVEVVTQVSRSMDKETVFRKGKLEELKLAVEENEAEAIVFLNNLSINVLPRIADYCGVDVIDRTTLILNIFSSRARTKEAFIQTEMARLKYNLPKYLRESEDSERQRGGVKNKGTGETRAAVIKRKNADKIAELRKDLVKIEKERHEKANHRNKSMLKKVALVGYTNAGKSSLMNALLNINDKSDKQVYEEDMLFATLDTSVRKIKYRNYEFLLFDTVGFVSDLPHDLIEAFQSTLSAAKEADLLINVIDLTNQNHENQIEVTTKTLKEIGVHDTPIINAYNKVDAVNKDYCYPIMISTKTLSGIEHLLDTVIEKIYPNEVTIKCLVPYSELGYVETYKNKTEIEIIEHTEEGQLISVKGPLEYVNQLKKFEYLD